MGRPLTVVASLRSADLFTEWFCFGATFHAEMLHNKRERARERETERQRERQRVGVLSTVNHKGSYKGLKRDREHVHLIHSITVS